MITKIAYAVVVGAIIGLGTLLLGLLLIQIHIPFVETVGHFLETWAWVIGLLFGLLAFLRGVPPTIP